MRYKSWRIRGWTISIMKMNLFINYKYFKTNEKYTIFVFSSHQYYYTKTSYHMIYRTNPLKASNPYGEQTVYKVLNDLFISNSNWKIVCLSILNPLGAQVVVLGEGSMEFRIILFIHYTSCNWKITIFKYIRSWLQYSWTCIKDCSR